MIGDFLEQYTYEYLLQLALSYVPDNLDKRQGSVIFDSIAPFCQLLSAGAMMLRNFYTETYALTSTGQDLDTRVAEQGVTRYAATYAVKRVILKDSSGNPMSVPIGTRFSTVSDTNAVNYAVTDTYKEHGVVIPGSYEATCEEAGVIGNQYSGNLISISFVQGLASAEMTTIQVPARDEETDEELRERYFESMNSKAFAGNLSDYRNIVRDLGVGAVQIYPVWNGGGTVKLSILDPEYNICSDEFVSYIQSAVDPENAAGERGLGLGLAPIGHRVTVVSPEEVTVNVSANITIDSGYDASSVKESIKEALEGHIKSLRESWATANQLNQYMCNVFISRVTATIITTPGVANVASVKLNNLVSDIILEQTGQVQQLPKLGEVTLNV